MSEGQEGKGRTDARAPLSPVRPEARAQVSAFFFSGQEHILGSSGWKALALSRRPTESNPRLASSRPCAELETGSSSSLPPLLAPLPRPFTRACPALHQNSPRPSLASRLVVKRFGARRGSLPHEGRRVAQGTRKEVGRWSRTSVYDDLPLGWVEEVLDGLVREGRGRGGMTRAGAGAEREGCERSEAQQRLSRGEEPALVKERSCTREMKAEESGRKREVSRTRNKRDSPWERGST